MKQLWNTVVIIAVAMSVSSCYSTMGTKADTVSGATRKYKQEKITLPPKASTYEVVGVVDGLKNYVIKYDGTLYRGGEPLADSAAQSLKKHGIRTIISVTPTEHERQFCAKNGFALVEIPFDKTTGLSPADLRRFLETIRNGNGPFYVHCHGGNHRGGALGVAYRLHILGWSYDKALVEFGRLGGDLLADHAMLESVRKTPK